jgi:archaeal flagellar protein FlaI
MLFEKKSKPGEYKIVREGTLSILNINYESYPKIPSIEDEPLVMASTIEMLSQNPAISKIIFHQQKRYEYSEAQTIYLIEVSKIYNHFIKQKKLLTQAALESWGPVQDIALKLKNLQYIILNLLKTDPVGAYVETNRFLREELIEEKNNPTLQSKPYVSALKELKELLEQTKLINLAREIIPGYDISSRDFYSKIFKPSISPDYIYTRYIADLPLDGREIDSYAFAKTKVHVFDTKETIKPLYHIIPPEFQISEDKHRLLEMARKVLAEHEPRAEEFIEPDRMRQNFYNIGRDLMTELATHEKLDLSYKEIEELANILVKYTVGFGMIENLLADPEVQDISINSPVGSTPMFIVHGKHGECQTNIVPTPQDVEGWASKFRLISARPLDEANPILDTELNLPTARARVAIIGRPLNPTGIAFSIRRHRDDPWTLPLFVKNKMITPLAAGLLSFLVDGARTMIVAGTRSSGKTSLLGSMLVEIMRKYRIITIEDTLELPTDYLRSQGYNIQHMKVRSALAGASSEVSADEGIRTSLRLGDSSLIVGEIRSKEALALYEAMRIGALANVVAGTIHGDSPYGVFDRVVNDLEVPKTSFKATDIIIVANPIKTPDGMSSVRRVTQITEVRKNWVDDPLQEGGFVDLMKYDGITDQLEPTDDLINGNSEIIKAIGGKVREWAGSWDAIWENINLRAKIKETLVEFADKYNKPQLIEAAAVIHLNDEFHKISNKIRTEKGHLDNDKIFFEWNEYLKKYINKI